MSQQIKYTKSYEYIIIENGTGVVGISKEATDKLGDIYAVELPEVGKIYDKDKEVGVIESVKSASDVFNPVKGEILEVNNNLKQNPELISNDPLGKGWIYKIKILVSEELAGLMEYDAFLKFIGGE
jgi:glycine cleavage system H protein